MYPLPIPDSGSKEYSLYENASNTFTIKRVYNV